MATLVCLKITNLIVFTTPDHSHNPSNLPQYHRPNASTTFTRHLVLSSPLPTPTMTANTLYAVPCFRRRGHTDMPLRMVHLPSEHSSSPSFCHYPQTYSTLPRRMASPVSDLAVHSYNSLLHSAVWI